MPELHRQENVYVFDLGDDENRLTDVAHVEVLLARMLALPMPTVAAVTGHAFGGGALLAMAHDWRVMRADRGYVCFPGSGHPPPVHPRDGRAHPGKADPGGCGDGDDYRRSVRRA